MKKLTPLHAIKIHCKECSGSTRKAKHCTSTDCPFYTFRLGKLASRKGIGNVNNFSKGTISAVNRNEDPHLSGQNNTLCGIYKAAQEQISKIGITVSVDRKGMICKGG